MKEWSKDWNSHFLILIYSRYLHDHDAVISNFFSSLIKLDRFLILWAKSGDKYKSTSENVGLTPCSVWNYNTFRTCRLIPNFRSKSLKHLSLVLSVVVYYNRRISMLWEWGGIRRNFSLRQQQKSKTKIRP